MKTHFLFAGLAFLALVAAALERAHAYEPPTPSNQVEVLRLDWHDAARDRDVPAKIYFPKSGAQLPIIIFSHGLGGSREGYEYLGRHWAGCGYVSVHLQHRGSDDGVWKDAGPADRMRGMREAAANLQNIANRPKDVSFAIDQMLAINTASASPLKGRLDVKHIGIAGHSFGGYTTMAVAGQFFPLANFADPRVTCAIQMSAPVARPAQRDAAYLKITMPVFHMTGTRDDSPIGDTKAAERRIPYDKMSAAETCLLILKDGDHMVFSGRERADEAASRQDDAFHRLICAGSTAFWDAWLRGDASAHAWLMDGAFAKQLGASGTFETKKPAK
jgi:predicted dienelactone hydrolase